MKTLKLTFLGLAAAVALTACGDTGSAVSGSSFRVDSINLENTAVNTTCKHSEVEGAVFQDEQVEVILANEGVREDVEPPNVILDRYFVEYIPLDGGPEISPVDYGIEQTLLVPSNSTLSFTATLIPIANKKEYLAATTDTTNYGATFYYQAKYRFEARTIYGDEVEATGSTTFNMGNTYIVDCK